MIKNTLILKKGNKMQWASFFMVAVAGGFALCSDLRILPIVTLNFYYLYKQDKITYFAHTLVLVIMALALDPMQALVYLGLSIAIFLNLRLHELLKLDIRRELIFWNTSFVVVAYYLLQGANSSMFEIASITLVINYFFTYLQEEDNLSQVNIFTIASATFLIVTSVYPDYMMYTTLVYLVVCAYLLPLNLCIFLFLYFAIQEVHYLYLIYLLLICNNRKQRLFLSLFSWVAVALNFELYNILFASICSIMGMFSYQSEDAFMKVTTDLEKSHQLYMEHSFYRQLVNYSSVFYDLSSYYEDKNVEEAEMLKLMGEALEYNAKVSKNYFYTQSQIDVRIKELLKGYKFSLSDCSCIEEDGKIRIKLEISHLYEGEVESVVVPLLEKLTQGKLRLVTSSPYPFQKEKFHIILESAQYLPVTTYGKSEHVKEVSGDSYHTFHMDQYVVMMLSDGMGQGHKAKKTSALLIQIMEAMMRCNIPQVECIKMINLFLRSDIYATLDILTIDRRANKAYLYKSASAPTYLLRDEKLYEMGAHSLPIGIVDNIQADVFEIPFQKNDIFIMSSDGVMKNEIEKWQSLKRCIDIKNEGLNLMNIIKEKRRGDDSTILLAKID